MEQNNTPDIAPEIDFTKQEEVKTFTNTKLNRHYFLSRLMSILCKYDLFIAIILLIMTIAAVFAPLFLMVYFIYAVVASFFLIIATLGLMLINVDQPGNPVHDLFAYMNTLQDEVIPAFQQVMKTAIPVISGIGVALSIALIVFVSNGLTRKNIHSDRGKAIACIVLFAICILISLLIEVPH